MSCCASSSKSFSGLAIFCVRVEVCEPREGGFCARGAALTVSCCDTTAKLSNETSKLQRRTLKAQPLSPLRDNWQRRLVTTRLSVLTREGNRAFCGGQCIGLGCSVVTALCRSIPIQNSGQKSARMRLRVARYLLRRSCSDDFTAERAALRTQIDYPVRGLDHVEVMLDHQQGSSAFQ